MNKKELFYFAGRCLMLNTDREPKREFIEQASVVDWYGFVALCSDHLILPAIYIRLKSNQLLGYLPTDMASHLKEIYELNVERNSLLLEQVVDITTLLNKKDIKPVFLKGVAHLLDGLYTDIGERMMTDIDFLVDGKDYLAAAEILKKNGYRQAYDIPDYESIDEQKHYPRLYHPDWGASVEIHRVPVDEKYTSWFNARQIKHEQVPVKSVPYCFVPSDRHKIIHNFIHSQLSNEGHLYGRISLRAIYDLFLLDKRFSFFEALPAIKPRQRAIAYCLIANCIFGKNKSNAKPNLAFFELKLKLNLSLRSKFFKVTFRSLVFIMQRFIIGYARQIFRAVYLKDSRQYIFKRLIDPDWYGNHLRLYSGFFKRKTK